MEKDKKEILIEQVQKLDEVLDALKDNFDINEEMADEYSFLSIVRGNLAELISQ